MIRLLRRAIKRPLLWINACRYQESEHEVYRNLAVIEDASRKMAREWAKQAQIKARHNEILEW